MSDDGSRKKSAREKMMVAMLMNGKEKHEVFDWSDIFSVGIRIGLVLCNKLRVTSLDFVKSPEVTPVQLVDGAII